MNLFDELYVLGKCHARHTIWVFSDLQQAKFENAKRCLDLCMEDYIGLGAPAEMLWYLGDSTEGADYHELLRMTKLQEDAFGSLGVPLAYASGNHDYDYADLCRRQGRSDFSMPFYEMVQ
ncbi:MAG: metallophosphoesterase, partial [Lachnospiraceae bacterium]|nr:metallophosphoesterase [Lachnospiraceae bacterium]